LIVFAGNDVHRRGQQAAERLASRLRKHMPIEIRLPHLKDFNDVLLEDWP
jgi:hypothetical protein